MEKEETRLKRGRGKSRGLAHADAWKLPQDKVICRQVSRPLSVTSAQRNHSPHPIWWISLHLEELLRLQQRQLAQPRLMHSACCGDSADLTWEHYRAGWMREQPPLLSSKLMLPCRLICVSLWDSPFELHSFDRRIMKSMKSLFSRLAFPFKYIFSQISRRAH